MANSIKTYLFPSFLLAPNTPRNAFKHLNLSSENLERARVKVKDNVRGLSAKGAQDTLDSSGFCSLVVPSQCVRARGRDAATVMGEFIACHGESEREQGKEMRHSWGEQAGKNACIQCERVHWASHRQSVSQLSAAAHSAVQGSIVSVMLVIQCSSSASIAFTLSHQQHHQQQPMPTAPLCGPWPSCATVTLTQHPVLIHSPSGWVPRSSND